MPMAMTLRLSDDDDALLTSTALAEGRSKQEIARAAIVEYASRRVSMAKWKSPLVAKKSTHPRGVI